MVHGHVFEIKEADYQTTCCCCFKTRVARGGLGRTKADLAHKTQLHSCVSFSWVCMKNKTKKNNFNELEHETAHCMHEKLDLWYLSEFFLFFEI